jgi:hypothetical protein
VFLKCLYLHKNSVLIAIELLRFKQQNEHKRNPGMRLTVNSIV